MEEKIICCKCRKECSINSMACASCYSDAIIKQRPFSPDYEELEIKIDELNKKLNEVLKFINFKKIKNA